MPRRLIVELTGDTRALEAAYRRSSHATRKFGKEVSHVGRVTSESFRSLGRSVAFASGAFLGGAGLIAVTRQAIDSAANLGEQLNKSRVVFGASAASVEAWSKTTAEGIGVAQDKALEFAGVFGNILVPMGLARTEAAKVSTGLVNLASDMASFNNASPEDVLEALRSGIVGQARPLRIYGVQLSEARVKAVALAEGIVKSTKGVVPALTDQQKVLARLSIIYTDAADALGDYGETLATSLPNQLRKFQSLVSDLQAELGTVLLPIILKVVTAFNQWLQTGDNRAKLVDALRGAVKALGDALGTVRDVIVQLRGPLQAVSDMLGGWKTTLELLVGAWVGFKVAGVTTAAAVEFANIAAAAGTKAAWRAALVATVWGAFAIAAGAAAAYIITHWDQVKDYFRKFWIDWQIFADEALLHVIEGFSHLPSFLGGWARNAKTALENDLAVLDQELNDFYLRQHQREKTAAAKGPKGTRGKVMDFLGLVEDQAARAQAAAAAALATGAAAAGAPTTKTRTQKFTRHKPDLAALAQARRDRRNAAQYRALGLTATGDQPAPGVRALRGMLGTLEEGIAGTFLDTKKTRSVIANVRKVLSGSLGVVGREMKLAIKGILDGLDQQLKEHRVNQTRFRRANTRAMLAGLGLDPDEIRRVRARIAMIGPGGVVPAGGSAAYGKAGVTIGVVHVHGVQDPRRFEQHMATRARSRPAQRRGV